MSDEVREILTELGYNLRDCGREYRAKPIYRDSDNPNVLSIKKDTGFWCDYKTNKYGNLEELVRITKNFQDISEARDFIKNKFNYERRTVVKEKIQSKKSFNKSNLDKLVNDYSYWGNRGVSSSILKLLQSGVMTSGKMQDRYVFPIFDKVDNLIGAAGRDITGESPIKWKLLGEKKHWIYPFKYNNKHIKEKKSVLLVESIGDMLALWEAGIKNTLVIFGLRASTKLKSMLISLNLEKIYICLNNDSSSSGAGNEAAQDLKVNLLNFFDEHQISINFPSKNDFGCMSVSEILSWKKKNLA